MDAGVRPRDSSVYPNRGGVQLRIEPQGVAFSEYPLLENASLGGSIDRIELALVEREKTL